MASCDVRSVRVTTALLLAMAGCTSSDQTSPAPAATNTTGCAWPASLDAVAAAPSNHRVLLENDRVRVLEVIVNPGEREPVHAHCLPGVEYTMSGGKYRNYDGQGKVISEGQDPPGSFPTTSWSEPAPPFSYENLDTTPMRMLRIELKR
jgi:hypothetical protein